LGDLLGVKFVSILFSVYIIQNIFVDMSRKVTMRSSMTNRPTCGGPKKAGLAPRGTNFMMGVKRNHRFSGKPFAGKAADYPMSCRGGGSSGGGNGLTLGSVLEEAKKRGDRFVNDYCEKFCKEPQITNYQDCCNQAKKCRIVDDVSDAVDCMEEKGWVTAHPCGSRGPQDDDDAIDAAECFDYIA